MQVFSSYFDWKQRINCYHRQEDERRDRIGFHMFFPSKLVVLAALTLCFFSTKTVAQNLPDIWATQRVTLVRSDKQNLWLLSFDVRQGSGTKFDREVEINNVGKFVQKDNEFQGHIRYDVVYSDKKIIDLCKPSKERPDDIVRADEFMCYFYRKRSSGEFEHKFAMFLEDSHCDAPHRCYIEASIEGIFNESFKAFSRSLSKDLRGILGGTNPTVLRKYRLEKEYQSGRAQ